MLGSASGHAAHMGTAWGHERNGAPFLINTQFCRRRTLGSERLQVSQGSEYGSPHRALTAAPPPPCHKAQQLCLSFGVTVYN